MKEVCTKTMTVYQRFTGLRLTSARASRLGTNTFHCVLRALLVPSCWQQPASTPCPSHFPLPWHKRSLNSALWRWVCSTTWSPIFSAGAFWVNKPFPTPTRTFRVSTLVWWHFHCILYAQSLSNPDNSPYKTPQWGSFPLCIPTAITPRPSKSRLTWLPSEGIPCTLSIPSNPFPQSWQRIELQIWTWSHHPLT